MPWIKRQKAIIAALILYWPAIFISTHIPRIPAWVGPVPFSDKTLHFMAYFLLSFLIWYAISPTKRVSWKRPAVWLILALIVWYGAMDEWLQGYVGRNTDVMDFAADLCGALTAFVILTIIDFWPAVFTVGAGVLCIASYYFKANADIIPVANKVIFSILSYGFYTAIWLRFIHYHLTAKCPQWKWWLTALILPVGLLAVIEIICAFAGRTFNGVFPVASLAVITMTCILGCTYSVMIAKRRGCQD